MEPTDDLASGPAEIADRLEARAVVEGWAKVEAIAAEDETG